MAAAYGAEEVDIFVITSSIVVTLTMPDLPPQTQTRRLRKSTGNDLLELEQLNALSRRICAEKPPVEEFQQQLSTILAQPGEPRLHLAGSVLAACQLCGLFWREPVGRRAGGRGCSVHLLDGAVAWPRSA